ncbi:TPA: carbohydrate ABC transporter permease [Candidatus Scatousia excrementigallinarum]|uniref:Carbohydrate ABC transporter permease n=1 Tax=Candidatus Scatousia excrementigallinarum TaxID=2840935 RepID=A0A9D1F1C3_9BACT|nr:carbohydrate ABC transporter permease [Candidatus Scatousia excrementigallinarum]
METTENLEKNLLHRRKLYKTILLDAILWILRIGFGFIFLFPLIWALSTSLKPLSEIVSAEIKLWINNPTLEHYKYVFSYRNAYRANAFIVAVINTSFLTGISMLTNLVFCTLAAYAFAKLRFKGHKALFKVFLSSMMIPGIITMVPTFVVIRVLNLWGSYWGVILPGATGVFNIFFMRQFFIGIPDELGESAALDGANELIICFRIYVPLVKPAIATMAVLCFQGGWNNFLMPYVVLPDRQLVLSTFIRTFPADNYAVSMAASMVATLPVLVLFIFFQKYFMNSITFSGIKE